VLGGAPVPAEPTDADLIAAVAAARATGTSTRDAAAEVAEHFGVGRKRVYDLALGAAAPPATTARLPPDLTTTVRREPR
jgi:hypothetical protein